MFIWVLLSFCSSTRGSSTSSARRTSIIRDHHREVEVTIVVKGAKDMSLLVKGPMRMPTKVLNTTTGDLSRLRWIAFTWLICIVPVPTLPILLILFCYLKPLIVCFFSRPGEEIFIWLLLTSSSRYQS
jgi:hypothetical protein